MNKLTKLVLMGIMLLGISCTDAFCSSISALGDNGSIKCYSGGKLIYDGISTGRIATTPQSDGWEFKEQQSGEFIRVSGDCLIKN